MSIIGRKTLKSVRARSRKIDIFFLRLLQLFLVCCGVFIFIAWLSYRPALQLNHIAIEGTHAIDPEHIEAIAHDAFSWKLFSRLRRDNVIFYPTRRVLALIREADSRVRDVNIIFDSRHDMRVAITEYIPDLLYCMQPSESTANASSTPSSILAMNFSNCYLATDEGYIYASSPEYSGYPFLVFIASSTEASEPDLSPIGTFVLPEEEYKPITEFAELLLRSKVIPRTITILGDRDVRIATQLPWDILWSSDKDPKESATNLQLALPTILGPNAAKSDFRIIDLRFGNKIFYK